MEITKKYISNGKLEENLKKYYLESDESKKMIEEVIKDLVDITNELTNISLVGFNMNKPTITPTHKLLR